MKLDKNVAYAVVINDNVVDIALGAWEEDGTLRIGLSDHSISFPNPRVIDQDKEQTTILDSEKNIIELTPMTKKLYDTMKGALIGDTAPELLTDEDVQEMFMVNR